MTPLSKSDYTILNTKDIVDNIKNTKAPNGYVAISFDVVSLFTNVPLRDTIILKKVYDEQLIETKITRKNLEKLLLVCTQGTPFTFNNKMYMQTDEVMMGSPPPPFWSLVRKHLHLRAGKQHYSITWRQSLPMETLYVDDTFAFIKPNKEQEIQLALNSFHKNIEFTYELEQDNKISFLDVLIARENEEKMETCVYRKPTHTDVYLNWNAHAPNIRKTSTVRSLMKRAFKVRSNDISLNNELNHLETVFTNNNDYPKRVITNIIKSEKEKTDTSDEPITNDEPTNTNTDTPPTIITLTLPYAGHKRETIINKMRKHINKTIPNANTTKVQIIYNTKKLGSKFTIKDLTKEEHQHNVVYHAKCPDPQCHSDYIGQTKCRLLKCVIQHNKQDKNSKLLIHSNDKSSSSLVG